MVAGCDLRSKLRYSVRDPSAPLAPPTPVYRIFRRIAHAVAQRHGRGSVISSLTPLRSCLAEPHNISARLTAVEAGPDLPQVQHVLGSLVANFVEC